MSRKALRVFACFGMFLMIFLLAADVSARGRGGGGRRGGGGGGFSRGGGGFNRGGGGLNRGGGMGVPGALSRTEVASDPIVGNVPGSVIVRSPAGNPVSATDPTHADGQRPMIAPTQAIGRPTGNARSG